MSGVETIREFEKKRYETMNQLRQLNLDMLNFVTVQGAPKIMLKRYDRIEREIQKLSCEMFEATQAMSKNSKCVLGEEV